MECSNCGKENEESSKFCVFCGTSLIGQEAAASEEPVHTQSQQQQQQPQQAETKTKREPNLFVETGKAVSLNYWRFFLEHLIHPSAKVEDTRNKQPVNSYINLVLVAIFLSLSGYFLVNAIGSGFVEFPFFRMVLFNLFYTLAAFAVIIAVLLLVLKVFMAIDINFKEITAQFGALMTVPMAISALYFLGSLPGLIITSFVLLCLLMVGGVIAVTITIYDHKSEKDRGFDPFFGVLAVIVGCLLFAAFMMLIGDHGFVPFSPVFNF